MVGFAGAFNLFRPDLVAEVSKIHGILWLGTTLLFLLTGLTFLFRPSWMYFPAIIAVIVSTFLIISVWKEAKFGMIPNTIILLAGLSSLSSHIFINKITNEISAITRNAVPGNQSSVKTQTIALPDPVTRWLSASGISGNGQINTVWLKQRIRMKMKPGQKKWNEAVASQVFTVENPAFIWSVRMKILPFISITGRDKFSEGKGEMLIKIFSLFNLVNEKGRKIDEATLQRYLAEIVWFPSAALSPYIIWEPVDSLTAKATMSYKGTHGSGTFYFNRQGDFVKFSTLRYKNNKPDARRYEWIITAKEHKVINGIRIPFRSEVSWVTESGSWTWLNLEITHIYYNPEDINTMQIPKSIMNYPGAEP